MFTVELYAGIRRAEDPVSEPSSDVENLCRSRRRPNPSARRVPSRLSQCSPPTPKADGVILTRWEIYYAVYLATLESRDAICANWHGTSVLLLRGSRRGAVPFGFVLTGPFRPGSSQKLPHLFRFAPTNGRQGGEVEFRPGKSYRKRRYLALSAAAAPLRARAMLRFPLGGPSKSFFELRLNLLQQNVHFVRLGIFPGQWKELFQRAPEVRLDRRFSERPNVGLLKPTFTTRERTVEKALSLGIRFHCRYTIQLFC
jgi:hypothetical protein